MAKYFTYVVGYPWSDEIPNKLCTYMWGGDLQYGTKKQAKDFLEYVRKNSAPYDKAKYAIYKVKYKKVS